MLIETFVKLLEDGNFLTASLHMSIEDEKYYFVEYVTDGKRILKMPGATHPGKDEESFYLDLSSWISCGNTTDSKGPFYMKPLKIQISNCAEIRMGAPYYSCSIDIQGTDKISFLRI